VPRPFVPLLVVPLLVAAVLGVAGCKGSSPDAAPVPADPQVAWVQAHALPIRSIDPTDEDFSDLAPLRQVLAGRRVVVLGEATHGDGATSLAKSRLIRFLHQEMGFDAIVFESGFYDCWKAWQRIEDGADPEAVFRQSVFPIWTRTAQLQDLIAYFAAEARSAHPLELAGIDPQFTGALSQQYLLGDLVRLADAVGLSGRRLERRIAAPLANLVGAGYELGELPKPAERAALLDELKTLEDRLRGDAGQDVPERGFWLRLLESTRANALSSWNTRWDQPLLESPEYPVRDRLMGEQLAWLAKHRYAGQKIVVWMHSGHAARGLSRVEVPSPAHARLYRTFKPAGAVARGTLGGSLYTVAVLAYQGRYRAMRGKSGELARPSDGSLEDMLHRTGFAHAFLDLSHEDQFPDWLRTPVVARPIGYMEMKARWQDVYDGVLFLDRMEPAAKAPVAPAR